MRAFYVIKISFNYAFTNILLRGVLLILYYRREGFDSALLSFKHIVYD